MSIDMELSDCWPEPVNVDVQVHYAIGPPDGHLLSVRPCETARAVRVFGPLPGRESLEARRIRWVDLPGRALYQRCLSVLALHWFGSIEMVPRVRGVPLWRSLSVEMTVPSADTGRLKVDLQLVDETAATLRYQFWREQPLVRHTVDLQALDADPLRALLRVGLGWVKPLPVPRKPASPRSRPSPRVDSGAHEPTLHV